MNGRDDPGRLLLLLLLLLAVVVVDDVVEDVFLLNLLFAVASYCVGGYVYSCKTRATIPKKTLSVSMKDNNNNTTTFSSSSAPFNGFFFLPLN